MTQATAAPAGEELAETIRQIFAEAESQGQKPPGRPTLVSRTGATDHQVKQVLAALERPASPVPASEPPEPHQDDTSAGQTPTSDSPAKTPEPPGGGLLVASLGFVFGSLVSIAANVLAAWIKPGDAGANWSPTLAQQVGAAVWPVALLISVEVISRVRWRHQSGRVFGTMGVAVVALGSAVISYGHIHAVLVSWGYDGAGAGVGPLVIDGLMIACGFALLNTPRQKSR